MNLIDNFLNSITMYRLMLYYLIFLVVAATIFGFFGLVPFSGVTILFSALFLVVVCLFTNKILAYLFHAPVNIESPYITALILSLIITPGTFMLPLLAGVIAMAGKYLLFWKKQHIFNPAAAAVVTIALLGYGGASWWVGTTPMLPALLLGILIVKKIRRVEQVIAFFGATVITMFTFALIHGNDIILVVQNAFTESPILFFAFVMFTEPLTSPTRRAFQMVYGVIVGVLYSSQLSFGNYYMTPEIALLVGNAFAYLVGMKERLVLKLSNKKNLASNIYEYAFNRPKNFSFIPGQYLEWTLSHNGADARGNRRFFTIASSPTENNLLLGVRVEEKGSSFKNTLNSLSTNQVIAAGQLSGDFILPKDKEKKLVFIAGGIGVTPFRSIVKYLLDIGERRDIVLLYCNKTKDEVVYKEIFDEATREIGLKTVYLFDRLTPDTLKQNISDYMVRTYYISGSHSMVEGDEDILKGVGVGSKNIVTDYFPGYA